MRVPESLIYQQIVRNFQKNMERMLRIQNQLSTGKRVNTPSDDPSRYAQSVRYTSLIQQMDQYLQNISRGNRSLEMSDTTLTQTRNVLNRVRELAVAMRSDTYDETDREAASQEVKQLLRELLQLANGQDGESYLYSGATVRGRYVGTVIGDQIPVTITAGSNDTLQIQVDGVTSGTITLTPGTYATGEALAQELQNQIDADATLSGAGVSVIVQYDDLTGRLELLSGTYGARSTVDVVGGTARETLGLVSGSATRGTQPFLLAPATREGARNTGGAQIDSGQVVDSGQVEPEDYVIRFTASNQYDVYRLTGTSGEQTQGDGGGVVSVRIQDPTQVTLDTYEIRFVDNGGTLEYEVVDTTRGVTVSSGNTYTSGATINVDGLAVVIQDGQEGPPQDGDVFTVRARGKIVAQSRTYTSGTPIQFEGLQVTMTGTPDAQDTFAVATRFVFNGDTQKRQIQVGQQSTAVVSLPAGDLFTDARGGVDLLGVVKSFYQFLQGNDPDALDTVLAQLDQGLEAVGALQAEVGANMNVLDSTRENLEAFKVHLTTLKSDTEDIDLVKAVSDLLFQENILVAAKGAAARLIQPTLLDFLR